MTVKDIKAARPLDEADLKHVTGGNSVGDANNNYIAICHDCNDQQLKNEKEVKYHVGLGHLVMNI